MTALEQTRVVAARHGGDSLAFALTPGSNTVRLSHTHIDEFDGDEDYWVTLGEFSATEIIAALLPPTPAAEHAALQHTRRPFWRRKRDNR